MHKHVTRCFGRRRHLLHTVRYQYLIRSRLLAVVGLRQENEAIQTDFLTRGQVRLGVHNDKIRKCTKSVCMIIDRLYS